MHLIPVPEARDFKVNVICIGVNFAIHVHYRGTLIGTAFLPNFPVEVK